MLPGLYRVWLTQWHLAVNIAALVVLSVAGTIAFATKRVAGERHLASRHSWVGLAVALFLALNVFQVLILILILKWSLFNLVNCVCLTRQEW